MPRQKRQEITTPAFEVSAGPIGLINGEEYKAGTKYKLVKSSTPVFTIFNQTIGFNNQILTLPESYSQQDLAKFEILLRKNVMTKILDFSLEELEEKEKTVQVDKPDHVKNWFINQLSKRVQDTKTAVVCLCTFRRKIEGWSPVELLNIMYQHEHKNKARQDMLKYIAEAIRVCPTHGIVNERFDEKKFLSSDFVYDNQRTRSMLTKP